MYKLLRPFGMIIFFAVVFYVVLNPLFIKAMGKSYKKKDKLSIIKKNTLASDTDLYIFSDAPSKKEDESAVYELREYLKTINEGFKNVYIYEAKTI